MLLCDSIICIHYISPGSLIRLRDQAKYYSLSRNQEDVANITPSKTCIDRSYEKKRLKNVRVVLEEKVLEVSSHIKDVVAKIKCPVSVVNNVLTSEKSLNMWSDIYNLKWECDLAIEILDSYLPRMKSQIHEFTDGRLAVSVSNTDFKIRLCEIIPITSAGIDFFTFLFLTQMFAFLDEQVKFRT